MAQARPKILTRFTVPTGGWAIDIDISDVAQYDTNVTATVTAGNYYMAWDHQSDDFIKEVELRLTTAIQTVGGAFASSGVYLSIDSDHKVSITFEDAFSGTRNDIRLNWTSMTEVGEALGFTVSANDTSTNTNNPTFTADHHHAYGWYADEDGLLLEDYAEDVDNPRFAQNKSISGHVKTQYFGSVFTNTLNLQFLSREKTFSNEVSYTDSPVYPYNRNEGLECWFREARQGNPFRVYRENQLTTALAAETGTTTSANSTQMSDGTKSWPQLPATYDRWVGRLLYIPTYSVENDIPSRWYINSHTSAILYVTTHTMGTNFNANTSPNTYYIFDQTYETYWLDLDEMGPFQPQEIPKIDRYNITIPLLKYES